MLWNRFAILVVVLSLIASLLYLYPVDVWAGCTTESTMVCGPFGCRTIYCTTCCFGGHCTTTCNVI